MFLCRSRSRTNKLNSEILSNRGGREDFDQVFLRDFRINKGEGSIRFDPGK